MKTSRPKQMTLDPLSSDDLRPELLTSGVTSSVTSGLTCSWPLDWPLMEHQVWPLTSAVTSVTFDLSWDRDQLWEFGLHLSDLWPSSIDTYPVRQCWPLPTMVTFDANVWLLWAMVTPYASADLGEPKCRCRPLLTPLAGVDFDESRWPLMPVMTSAGRCDLLCRCWPLQSCSDFCWPVTSACQWPSDLCWSMTSADLVRPMVTWRVA